MQLANSFFNVAKMREVRYNKLTVDKAYRNLVLPLDQIAELSWKWGVFPIATFNMKNGEKYKIIIFNKARFEKWFCEYSK